VFANGFYVLSDCTRTSTNGCGVWVHHFRPGAGAAIFLDTPPDFTPPRSASDTFARRARRRRRLRLALQFALDNAPIMVLPRAATLEDVSTDTQAVRAPRLHVSAPPVLI